MKLKEIIKLKEIYDEIVEIQLLLNRIKSQHYFRINCDDGQYYISEKENYELFNEIGNLIEIKLKKIKLENKIEDQEMKRDYIHELKKILDQVIEIEQLLAQIQSQQYCKISCVDTDYLVVNNEIHIYIRLLVIRAKSL